jgi:hypothetical protein
MKWRGKMFKGNLLNFRDAMKLGGFELLTIDYKDGEDSFFLVSGKFKKVFFLDKEKYKIFENKENIKKIEDDINRVIGMKLLKRNKIEWNQVIFRSFEKIKKETK